MIRNLIVAFGLLAFVPGARAAKTPTERKISKDVSRQWKKQWPEQDVAHVVRKSECQEAVLEVPSKVLGKTRKLATCQLEVDVYLSVGHRYHIYRDSHAYYQGSRLLRLERGEFQKAWKAGGVPAPSLEQAAEWLQEQAEAKLGQGVKLRIVETGKPRIFGEVFRLTYVVELSIPSKEGQEQTQKGMMATFESDGGEWKAVDKLAL